VERVGCAPAISGGIGEWIDDLQLLDDRAGPSVGNNERQRVCMLQKGSKRAVGKTELRLALDGVSGPATGMLAATLSPRGTLVSFAAMSSKPMSISPLDVIFKPVTVRGFFMAYPEFAAKLAPAAAQAAEMIASGRMHIPVAATYALSSIKEAVAHAQRGGKILLDVAGSST
jgi:NADPH:quinone reductase-like Zn-dependent oxidoreductase